MCWKPVWHVLEAVPELRLLLANAHAVKNMPGPQDPGGSRLALAVAWAAVVSAPFGLAETGPDPVALPVLLAGLGIAVVSAAIPYSLDLAALRRLSPGDVRGAGEPEPVAAAAAGW